MKVIIIIASIISQSFRVNMVYETTLLYYFITIGMKGTERRKRLEKRKKENLIEILDLFLSKKTLMT